MPRLVHLNGPPGIGKSTLARRYVHDHPLAFCLDIDGFRHLIGRWDEHEQESGRLARRMALTMAREHLSSGHDVILPQLVAGPEFVFELRDVAASVGASFFEIILLDRRQGAAARFEARSADPIWTLHHEEASRMIDANGGFEAMFDRFIAAIPSLPAPVEIETSAGQVELAYRAVLAAVEASHDGPVSGWRRGP